jgi:transposase InsO family protein
MVTGMEVQASAFQRQKQHTCEPCCLSKQHKEPFPVSQSDSTTPLELLHMDLCGPITPTSPGGARYIATFLDDYSKLSVVVLLKAKSDVPQAIANTVALLENQSGHRLRRARSDNGLEYVNASNSAYFEAKGVHHQRTTAYTPEQNGAAERLNRTVCTKARSMLADRSLPDTMWAEAVAAANYLRNRSPVTGRDATPYQLFYGVVPPVGHLRVFGCAVHVLIPLPRRKGKLAPVSQPGRLVGYSADAKAYRILLADGRTVVEARNVLFHEQPAPAALDISEDTALDFGTADVDSSTAGKEPARGGDWGGEASEQGGDGGDQAGRRMDRSSAGSGEATGPREQPASGSSKPVGARAPPDPSDRMLRPRVEGRVHWQSDPPRPSDTPKVSDTPKRILRSSSSATAFAAMCGDPDPTTVQAALASPEHSHWEQAMCTELAALESNNTWTLQVPPPGARVIPTRWVYKTKRSDTGEVVKYKARLVAKGFVQQPGRDYTEVFAPVSSRGTLRAFLAHATVHDWQLHQVDIQSAFLNGELDEDVYVQYPPGVPNPEPGTACHLQRALYGLKQAPRAWHTCLDKQLASMGFRPSAADPSLYASSGEERTLLLVYVDDILIASPTLAGVQKVKAALRAAWQTHDLGEARLFLGMVISRNRDNRTLTLSQEHYTRELVARFGMSDAKPVTMPLSPADKLLAEDGEPLNSAGQAAYAEAVGAVMYLMTCTRPEIAHAVGALARHTAAPTTAHLSALKRLLAYLSGTTAHALHYGPASPLVGYADADYAGNGDGRRSTTGFVFIYHGGAITYRSRLQSTVATSTTEAEYMAAADAVKEALWIGQLVRTLERRDTPPGDTGDWSKPVSRTPQAAVKPPAWGIPIPIYGDNQGAIQLLHNPVTGQRSKHIDVQYHFAREHIQAKRITVTYISTDLMLADGLTKAVPKPKLDVCCKGMGLHS